MLRLFRDGAARVDEAASVVGIVAGRAFVIRGVGQFVLQRADRDARVALFDQRGDAGGGGRRHAGAGGERIRRVARTHASGRADDHVEHPAEGGDGAERDSGKRADRCVERMREKCNGNAGGYQALACSRWFSRACAASQMTRRIDLPTSH